MSGANAYLGLRENLETLNSGGALLGVKKLYFQHVKKKLGDGVSTTFWEDWWVGSKPLKDAYPRLYNISFDHNISVAEAIQKGWGGSSLDEL